MAFEVKHSSIFESLRNDDSANLWSVSVYPWLLALPWQYDNEVIDRTFGNQTKNSSNFTNQSKSV